MRRRLKRWGWGYEDELPSPAELQQTAAFLAEHLGFGEPQPEPPAPPPALPATRLRAPGRLAAMCSVHDRDRARHSLGSSNRDVVRGFRGRFEHVTDVVARPREETEVDEVLDWAIGAGAAVIPYGGGTSVVGGVEPDVGVRYNGVVTLDLRALDRVLEVDPVSRAARIQAGATGPGLEEQLRAAGLTLRHYPQSSSSPPSAAGSPPAPRVISPRRTRTSTTSWSLPGRSHRPGCGIPPAAGLGCRRLTGPDADRLRGHPRSDHRCLGASAPAADSS